MSLRPVLVLLLACLSFPLMAREARQLGPDGGGPCEDPTAQANDATGVTSSTSSKPATRAARAVKAARPAMSRGGDSGSETIRPPRWHSFLPGMFR